MSSRTSPHDSAPADSATETPEATEDGAEAGRGPRISPYLLWFGVLGGIAAWTIHLLVAWSTTEVSCYAPTGASVDNHGGTLGTSARAVVVAFTVGPWLVAWAAFAACLLVRRRRRVLQRDGLIDVLATERMSLLLVLGVFLDLMGLAAITGGGVALLLLEPCR